MLALFLLFLYYIFKWTYRWR